MGPLPRWCFEEPPAVCPTGCPTWTWLPVNGLPAAMSTEDSGIFSWSFGTIATALEVIEKPLYYTGHSLGGALATLAASLRPPCAVYTFGAPRIGNAEFAQTLAGIPVFNVFNPKDIVPELPPGSRRTRFTHAGTIVRNAEINSTHRGFSQAPSFLANHAPLNYTAQLPVATDN
jgi:alpha-beta hydrolase superfamily lysophospholipase